MFCRLVRIESNSSSSESLWTVTTSVSSSSSEDEMIRSGAPDIDGGCAAVRSDAPTGAGADSTRGCGAIRAVTWALDKGWAKSTTSSSSSSPDSPSMAFRRASACKNSRRSGSLAAGSSSSSSDSLLEAPASCDRSKGACDGSKSSSYPLSCSCVSLASGRSFQP